MDDLTIIPRPRKILYMGYNYNSSYFMIGTDIGFQVHQTYPLALKFSRILNGGIGLVQNLNKSNIFCLVGGGVSPKYAPNKLLIWDDKAGKEIYEFRFNSYVLNCFIKLKYIFIFCKDTINIISLQTMKTVEIILTIDNPDGVGTISSAIDKYILSWPDLAKGKIALKDFSELKSSSVTLSALSHEQNSLFKQKLSFRVHESGISLLKLNDDGSKLATASKRGTIIRIIDTINACVIQELKRGNGESKIYSINFSYDNNFVGITSDHGTAHIFVINKNKAEISNAFAESSKIIEKENKIIEDNIINNDNDNDNQNKDDINNNKINILNEDNNINDFEVYDKENKDEKIIIDNEEDEIEEKNEDDNNNEKNIVNNNIDNRNNFEIINDEMTKSDVIEKNNNYQNQKSILSGVSKMMGFSSIFQSEWSFTSFKIPYKEQSFISFIQGDKNNNKIIVIDKSGNYTAAEINKDKETKIIQRDFLI